MSRPPGVKRPILSVSRPVMMSSAQVFARRGDDWSMDRHQRRQEYGVDDFIPSRHDYALATLDTGLQRLADDKVRGESKARHERRAKAAAQAAQEAPLINPFDTVAGDRRRLAGKIHAFRQAMGEAASVTRRTISRAPYSGFDTVSIKTATASTLREIEANQRREHEQEGEE